MVRYNTLDMSKFPTEYAYSVAVQSGKYVVYRMSKYRTTPSNKYGTREEAQVECDKYNYNSLVALIESRIRTEYIKYYGTEVDFIKSAARKIANNLKTVI